MPGASSSPSDWSSSRDDGWGPATAVRTSGRAASDAASWGSPRPTPRRAERSSDDWSAGPAPRSHQRAVKSADRRTERSMRDLDARLQDRREAVASPPERGLPWWAALGVLIVVALVGGILDTIKSIGISGGFNIGIVVASLVAILLVKRSHMFPVVIAPPIVYSLAAVFQLYFRQRVLGEKGVLIDAASNYLVYGFPAIAAASAAVLIIAGIRMIARR